jgi:streptogramin lyase
VTPFTGIAALGQGGEALNSAEVEALYEVLKVGIDTSGGTLRLPLVSGDTGSTFPYIWVANSGENTISKLDTNTGAELGRYRTAPDGVSANPSRTTVDQDGNVWVGNRDGNTITKVGLKEFGQCIDRNGNGVIDTSAGDTDVKGWTGPGLTGAADECILQHVALSADGVTTPNDIRTVAIDPNNNVLVGGYNQRSIFKVNSATGAILAAVEPAVEASQSLYGGVVDKQGNLWSMSSGSGKVQKTSNDFSTTTLYDIGHSGYGIAIDKYGKIWSTEYGSRFSAFDPSDPVGTLKVFTQTVASAAQGIATDDNGDVFIAGSLSGNTVGHYKQVFNAAGEFTDVTFVANYPVGQAPTGVAVDGVGKVWATNYNDNSVSRITLAADPANAVVDTFPVGLNPYNYSDMTGRVVRTITNRQGTWEATFDGKRAGFAWGKVVWQLKEALPAGTDVVASVKAADTLVAMGALDYVNVDNDAALAGVVGRYMKVRMRLTSGDNASTPEVIVLQIY